MRRLADLFAPRRWCTWRSARRLLLALAIVATLIVAFYAVENWRGHRAYAAFAREAADAGVSLDLRECAPPPVPDELNLAKIAPYDLPVSGHDAGRLWSELADQYRLRKPDGAPFTYAPSSWYEDKTIDLASARSDLGGDLALYLARFDTLDDDRRSILARPYLRYEYRWEDTFAILLPNIQPMRELGRVLTFHAEVALEAGDTASAARDIEAVLGLGSAMREDPFLISQLMATTQTQLAVSVFWEGQRRHIWDHSQLAAFEQALARPKPLESYHRALKAELAAATTLLRQLAHDTSTDVFSLDDSDHGFLWRFAPSGWLRQNIVSIGRVYFHQILPAIDPASRRVIRSDLPAPLETRQPYTFLVSRIVPTFGSIVSKAVEDQASLDLARIACALERHYLTQGSYPEMLAPIVDDSAALAVLRDPMNGEFYRYRRTPSGGFEAWALGTNGKDDGGSTTRLSDGRFDRKAGDLVWRIPGSTTAAALGDKWP